VLSEAEVCRMCVGVGRVMTWQGRCQLAARYQHMPKGISELCIQ